MSVNTLVKDGLLRKIKAETKIIKLDLDKGDVHYNPGLARDPEGKIYISIRSCITNYKEFNGVPHPLGYENFLHVGILEESTLEIKGLKLVEPEAEYEGFQWGIEDIRLFWREDGLHGIGVIIPLEGRNLKLRQAEILIDYEKGTYKLLKDWGRPFGHAEKNWSPTEHVNENFDFVYSPTQIVNKNGEVVGEDNDLFIHNGTPLIALPEGGYISIGHAVLAIFGERTYGQVALKFDDMGGLIEHSQFFHFDVGWREQLQETIEFASGLLWSDGKVGEELLVGLGIKDELLGLCRLPMSQLKFEPYADTMWYAWKWEGQPNRVEISA
jgi:hypothetical protein